jgi:hypothetical protein
LTVPYYRNTKIQEAEKREALEVIEDIAEQAEAKPVVISNCCMARGELGAFMLVECFRNLRGNSAGLLNNAGIREDPIARAATPCCEGAVIKPDQFSFHCGTFCHTTLVPATWKGDHPWSRKPNIDCVKFHFVTFVAPSDSAHEVCCGLVYFRMVPTWPGAAGFRSEASVVVVGLWGPVLFSSPPTEPTEELLLP